MGDMPHNRHGLIPMLVAIRVAAERKRREAEAGADKSDKAPAATEARPKKKRRDWFS
ncbi:MAG: hypothetical protein KKE42_03850 [Alphaproteobacteria bacterium]|uniref:hypothetical protein n=1 Tax=Brevundimonas sp. TaxID=1871086 RepID=UPI001E13EE30|nr:hypothetical protein [Brevundimonas sp.]MBU3972108.1 hypothetical protein [Alphaproteobacteria bacterium]MBU3972919.1 hypothetical protein [Alphaproteobacteria bacterium]MBU4038457.1 hypothetical protein [Alphaproteobacteria bacterium]MBU4136491.1 hypothetical protein [Alphaproteobacteria bacterium]